MNVRMYLCMYVVSIFKRCLTSVGGYLPYALFSFSCWKRLNQLYAYMHVCLSVVCIYECTSVSMYVCSVQFLDDVLPQWEVICLTHFSLFLV